MIGLHWSQPSDTWLYMVIPHLFVLSYRIYFNISSRTELFWNTVLITVLIMASEIHLRFFDVKWNAVFQEMSRERCHSVQWLLDYSFNLSSICLTLCLYISYLPKFWDHCEKILIIGFAKVWVCCCPVHEARIWSCRYCFSLSSWSHDSVVPSFPPCPYPTWLLISADFTNSNSWE